MTPTDTQLKQVLAKMLPEELNWYHRGDGCWDLCWVKTRPFNITTPVLDTELLHLCWLVETSLDWENWHKYTSSFDMLNVQAGLRNFISASWQQRTIALAKVKGIEIV